MHPPANTRHYFSTLENQTLITAVMQYSNDAGNQKHPTILSFQVSPMKGCLDPLLLRWLDYRVTYYKLNTPYSRLESLLSLENATTDVSSRKKTFPSLHESVHSSSDKEKRKIDEAMEKATKKSVRKMSESDKVFAKSESVQEVRIHISGIDIFFLCKTV